MIGIGLTINADAPMARMRDIARQAEAAGFDFAYVADQGFTRDVWVTLAMALRATERLRVGPGITNALSRSLNATVAAMRSLQAIGGSRAFLGLGAGGTRLLGPLHLEPARPLAVLEEALAYCRERLDGDISLAGRGPKVLELGGRTADEVFLSAKAFFELSSAVAAIRRGAAANPRPVRIHWACHLAIDDAIHERIRQRYSYTLVDSTDEVRRRLGISDADAHDMMMAARTSGLAASARWVTDDMLREFVILDREPASAAKRIAATVKEHGFDAFVLNVANPDVADAQIDFVRRMIPLLR